MKFIGGEAIMEIEERQIELLKSLDKICKVFDDNEIDYYLLGGSVLGAVRHKGIIPWDDDIDVGVFRKDLPRVESMLGNYTNNEYIFEPSEQHIIADAPIAKFRKKVPLVSIKDLPTIDIFALDYAPNHKIGQNIQVLYGNIYNLCIYGQVSKNRGKLSEILTYIFLFIFRNRSRRILAEHSLKRITKWKRNKCDNITNLYGYPNKKELFSQEVFGKGTWLEFNGKLRRVPYNYEYYLKQLYGDYKVLPPYDERKPKHVS